MPGLGRLLIILGGVLIGVGLLISLAPRLPWLGRLPGDILIKRENFSFYLPLASSLLVSLLLSFIAWLFRR